MARLVFTESERQQLRRERFEHPHPRVQLRMEVLWLISGGESYSSVARLAGVSDATVDRYVALYRAGGIDGLKQFDWQGPTSELAAHQTSLEEEFRARPPSSPLLHRSWKNSTLNTSTSGGFNPSTSRECIRCTTAKEMSWKRSGWRNSGITQISTSMMSVVRKWRLILRRFDGSFRMLKTHQS